MSQSAECGATVVPEWYASHPKHDTVWVVAARMRFYLLVGDVVKAGDEVKFIMSKNYSWKIYYLQIILINIYQLKSQRF